MPLQTSGNDDDLVMVILRVIVLMMRFQTPFVRPIEFWISVKNNILIKLSPVRPLEVSCY